MVEIYSYTDYRKFLADYLENQKSRIYGFSIRYFAGKIGIDAGNLVKVISGERHLSKMVVDRTVSYLKLKGRDVRYFRTLVAFGKAKKESEIKNLFEQLTQMKQLEPFHMSAAMAEFYQSWYHSAITGYLASWPFKNNYEELARSLEPPVSVKQARQSISLLKKLGIIAKDHQGYLRPVRDIISTGDKWHSAAIQSFQRETLKLALNALEYHPKTDRDFSTVSFAVSKDDFQEIRNLAREFRSSVLRIARDSEKADRVYQMNLQVFPLTKKSHRQ